MNKFTLKNYPPNILIILVCLIVAINFGLQMVWKTINDDSPPDLPGQIFIVFASYSIVTTAITLINKYAMWKWLLKLLGLCDVRGSYAGKLTSSYYIDNDSQKGHIVLTCKVQILQNINGLYLEGDFYTDDACQQHSSNFTSFNEEIEKLDNGNFQIRYFFNSKGDQLHPDDQKYGLTNHTGVGVLTFKPTNRQLSGYYFNHERHSFGNLTLEPQP